MLIINLNGESHEVADGTTVASLIEELGMRPELLAVERNRDIVPKAAYGEEILRDGDVVEIVTFVGGG